MYIILCCVCVFLSSGREERLKPTTKGKSINQITILYIDSLAGLQGGTDDPVSFGGLLYETGKYDPTK